MDPILTTEQVTIEVRTRADDASTDLAHDVRRGLTAEFKELPPKYFYDDRGSRLFERITELPEYYPTRTERRILDRSAADIVAAADPHELVELGSGSAAKTRTLLDAMRDAGCLRRYVPVDISAEITRETAERLTVEYPGLAVHGVVCDFVKHLEDVLAGGERRLVAFLGGTIGNFPDGESLAFLSRIASVLNPSDRLLMGTDLVKDRARLEAAYDDAAGVTAEFNKNVLWVLNRELGADFDPGAFEHVAFYDEARARIDIRLRSLVNQRVRLPAIDLEVDFAAGEEMRTELSCKFTRPALERLYGAAGLRLERWYTDEDGLFALSLASAA